MVRIYSKTGDDGTTGLIGGQRVSKSAPRIEAYGTVDELNSLLGMVRSLKPDESTDRILLHIQNQLFGVGSNLALPDSENRDRRAVPALGNDRIAELEKAIEDVEAGLEPLREFILPGGTQIASVLHLARAVARRAERRCVALSNQERVEPEILRYLNRLSDLLFSLARRANALAGQKEANPTSLTSPPL